MVEAAGPGAGADAAPAADAPPDTALLALLLLTPQPVPPLLCRVPIDILNECGDPDNGIYPETSTTTDPSFGSTITTSETGLDVGSPLSAI